MSDIPEGAVDAMTDLFDKVLRTIDEWEEKSPESEEFKQDVVINTMTNVLAVMSMEYDYEPEFIIHSLLSTLRVNGAFDDDHATVH
jgi:hypothetical protein